jgi:hypothetical protein
MKSKGLAKMEFSLSCFTDTPLYVFVFFSAYRLHHSQQFIVRFQMVLSTIRGDGAGSRAYYLQP